MEEALDIVVVVGAVPVDKAPAPADTVGLADCEPKTVVAAVADNRAAG